MPWKKKDGAIVIGESGNPVYVYPDGNEIDFDGDDQIRKIRELTTKASKRKDKISSLQTTTQILADAGIDVEDTENIKTFVTTAKKNASTVANFKDGDFVKAGEVDKIKSQVKSDYERQITGLKESHSKEVSTLKNELVESQSAIEKSIVKGAFDRSKFIRDKTSYPTTDSAYADLKGKFKVEKVNGKMVGFGMDSEGNKIYSLKQPTKHAELDEAIEIIITNHPQKDQLLLADGGGGGADPSKKKTTISDQKVVKKGDRVAFGNNLEDIASGKVKVEM